MLSGTKLRNKTGNVEAAHIFGVEPALAAARNDAGVLNPYDTSNGMLLEKSLHTAFDAYLWCMDESLRVHVSEEGIPQGLGKWQFKKLQLKPNEMHYPSSKFLKKRYELFRRKNTACSGVTGERKRQRKSLPFTV